MKSIRAFGCAALLAGFCLSLAGQSTPQVLISPGVISTVTTNPYSGDATSEIFSRYTGIAVDTSGNLYLVVDCVVEKLNPATKAITVVVGNAGEQIVAPGPASCPPGNGSGDGGPAINAHLALPTGIAVDASGNIYISQGNVVREVTASTGIINTIAGDGTSGPDSGDGGPATSATLYPGALAVDAAGNLYIGPNGLPGKVRRVDATTHIITTIAGNGTRGFSGANGPAIDAELGEIGGLAVDPTGQSLYIADYTNSVVWKVNLTTGFISVYAGIGTQPGYSGDGGPATAAHLSAPASLAFDSNGNLYILDNGNIPNLLNINYLHGLVREISGANGVIETVAGNGTTSYAGDGSLATATGLSGSGARNAIAIDGSSTLYISNQEGQSSRLGLGYEQVIFQILKVTPGLTLPIAAPGLTTTQTLHVENFGNVPLVFTSPITVNGTNASDFTARDNCDGSIAVGAFCTVSLTFAPSAIGARIASLVVTDNAPDSPQTVPLAATSATQTLRLFNDVPGARSSPFLGLATFSGWAIDNVLPVTDVAVSIDGAPRATALYGGARPDVCVVFPNQIGCPNVGWSFQLDTTRLANGTHALEVTATSANGEHSTLGASFFVANWTASNPTLIDVDVPNANTPYSGSTVFTGWAINDDALLNGIAVSVDGAPYYSSTVTYGGNRPDVCAVYPNRPNCPNVGWSFLIDTTALADGTHTLAVTATPASGASTTVTTSFTTANWATNPTKVVIDSPSSQSAPLSGAVPIMGWAMNSNNNATYVAASVDGGLAPGVSISRSPRPDVCGVYPSAGCVSVGWFASLDTTKLTNGSHVLQVTASLAGLPRTGPFEQNATAAVSFTVANPVAANPFKIFIDVPAGPTSLFSGVATLSGWAINDNAAISQLFLYVDNDPYPSIAANYGLYRPDVCAVYPGRAGCPNVGWSAMLDTTQLANGAHTLTVTANNADFQSYTVRSSFSVANWTSAGNPMVITVDSPSSSSAPLTGASAQLAGWAIDNQASITSVSVGVDGIFNGNAVYGTNRPDVCAVFPNRPNCPNVGWAYLLDTTLLADGPHTLDITASAADGQSYTLTSSFKVANLTPSNPIRIFIDNPSAANNSFSGMAAFLGWAIDDNAAIGSVNVYVDGAFAGAAAYGVPRSDVCAVFHARSGCPNVGWNFVLDTAEYANGAHTLNVTALAANGQKETVSAPFTISN